MPGDLVGFLLSGLLIGLCMGIALFVVKFGSKSLGSLRLEIARKIVHIGVSNWFFIYYYCFQTIVWPIVGLGAFAVLNFVLTLNGTYGAVLGTSQAKRSWGVVYYPLAVILLLVLLELGVGSKVDVGCGLLGMGYGDGLAALVGMKFGNKKLFKGSKKTVAGSVAMMLVVALIVFALKSAYGACTWGLFGWSLVVGLVSSVSEAVTPLGLDNISVPVVVFLMAALV